MGELNLDGVLTSYNLDPFAVSFVDKSPHGLALRFIWYGLNVMNRSDLELAKLDLGSLREGLTKIEANEFPVTIHFGRFFKKVSITITARNGDWLNGRARMSIFSMSTFWGYWPNLVQLHEDAERLQKLG